MFTKNWYKAVASYVFDMNRKVSYTAMDGKTTQYISNSCTIDMVGGSGGTSEPALRYLRPDWASSGGVLLGTGTTPATVDDCTMSGTPVSTYTYSTSLSITPDANGVTTTALYTITNTGSAAFTIGEIGLAADLTGNSGSALNYKALLERTVLDSPLTIEPGGVGQLTYTIRFNYPTA